MRYDLFGGAMRKPLEDKAVENVLQRGLAKELHDELLLHPGLSFGFALLWAWTRLAFGTSSFDESLLFGFDSTGIVDLILVFSNALAYLAIGILYKLRGVVFSGKAYRRLIAIAVVAGTVFCEAPSIFSAEIGTAMSLGMGCFGAVFLGIGIAFYYVEWARILGFLGPRTALIHAFFGLLGSGAILFCLNWLPVSVQFAYLVGAPLAIMQIVSSWTKGHSKRVFSHGLETKSRIPWRLLVTAAVVGASFGLASEIGGMGNYVDPALVRNALTFIVAGALLLFSAVLFRMDFNQLMYRVGMPVIAAGCLLFVVLGGKGYLGGFLFSVGYLFMDLLIWVLLAYMIKHQALSANWVVALVVGCLLLGRSGGDWVARMAVAELGLPMATIHNNLLVIVVYALMFCALVVQSKKNIRFGWGAVKPAGNENYASGLDAASRIVAEDHGLTPRETEILTMLARGYSRETISKSLVLAKETVRTHATNIFRKVDVHSHQELIAVVEDQAKLLDE